MESSCSEIGLELYEVNLSEALNRLQFQNHLTCYHQINAGSAHYFTLEAYIHRKL